MGGLRAPWRPPIPTPAPRAARRASLTRRARRPRPRAQTPAGRRRSSQRSTRPSRCARAHQQPRRGPRAPSAAQGAQAARGARRLERRACCSGRPRAVRARRAECTHLWAARGARGCFGVGVCCVRRTGAPGSQESGSVRALRCCASPLGSCLGGLFTLHFACAARAIADRARPLTLAAWHAASEGLRFLAERSPRGEAALRAQGREWLYFRRAVPRPSRAAWRAARACVGTAGHRSMLADAPEGVGNASNGTRGAHGAAGAAGPGCWFGRGYARERPGPAAVTRSGRRARVVA